MRHRRTALLAGLALAALAAPARADVQIAVDKTAQRMQVSVDGQPRYTWPVSTGAEGYDTPGGSYRPFRMEANHFSREWDNAPMPHAIFFTKIGHAIHGTGHVRGLGQAASHGCVRLAPGHAATLFNLVKAEGMARTQVTITGSPEPRVAARPARPARVYDEDGVMSVGLRPDRAVRRVRTRPAAMPDPYADPYGRGVYDPYGGY